MWKYLTCNITTSPSLTNSKGGLFNCNLGRYFSSRHYGTASAWSRERRKSDVLSAADRKTKKNKIEKTY